MIDPLPRPVPTGTDHYYRDRLADFTARCPDSAPPTYYDDYGDKCLHQFRRTQPNLTSEGQRWLERTLVDLQDRLEKERESDPSRFGQLEKDSDAFAEMTFEMHSDAYVQAGVAELPVSDLLKIVNTPDVSDLVTPKGLEEILEVLEAVSRQRARSALRRVVDFFKRLLSELVGARS